MSTCAWNLPGPPGFRGLREDLPLTVYWRHLPHWRQDGATYFVTFRLADSLPHSKLRELDQIKHDWVQKERLGTFTPGRESALRDHLPRERWEAFTRMVVAKMEGWLDEGMGECWMKHPEVSQIVANSLKHSDNGECELGAYVVMPNHVHAILRPLHSDKLPLEIILKGRKQRTAREINRLFGRRGVLWQDESYDRIVRDDEHLYQCVQYIGRNPTKARLAPGEYRRWIRPSWVEAGWKFEE